MKLTINQASRTSAPYFHLPQSYPATNLYLGVIHLSWIQIPVQIRQMRILEVFFNYIPPCCKKQNNYINHTVLDITLGSNINKNIKPSSPRTSTNPGSSSASTPKSSQITAKNVTKKIQNTNPVSSSKGSDTVSPASVSTKKPLPKAMLKKPFSQLFENVVFIISGYENPLRSEIRRKAIELGGRYKPDWDNSCTHLM